MSAAVPRLAIVSCAVATAAAQRGTGCRGSTCRPNFLFILADDWGWGDLGADFSATVDSTTAAAGTGPNHTPNLNRLARRGTLFMDFHSASPVCSPSRAGWMTGRYPARFRIHTALNADPAANLKEHQANFLPASTPTVTSILQADG